MLIGIPKEIKKFEYRVGATPSGVRHLVEDGHTVLVEKDAGLAVGFTNDMYEKEGAKIAPGPKEVYDTEMIIKVKEPQKPEFSLLKSGQILFGFLHLAPDAEQTKQLIEKEVVAIAYETVTDDNGRLPLLLPMSEIAGRISIQSGATCLQMNNGGKGLLLGGVPGVFPANVVIIGAGVVGTEAARMAIGMNANVTILDKNIDRLRIIDTHYAPKLKTLYSTIPEIENVLKWADLVIGAVLIPGKTAPKLISREMLKIMNPGSVLVDVAIDQGGIAETSRPTTHGNPTFIEEGVVHYCVTNMPGACARTSTIALTNSTLDYALKIAGKGYKKALSGDQHLMQGLNVCKGLVTNAFVANDLNYDYTPPAEALNLI